MVALTPEERQLLAILRRCQIERRVLERMSPEAREAAAALVRDGLARWHQEDDGEYLSLSETDERTT